MAQNRKDIKTFDDLYVLAEKFGFSVDQDNEGQLILYTNLREDERLDKGNERPNVISPLLEDFEV